MYRFDMGFSVGTEHPKAGWSERTLKGVLNPSLPGPDGIDTFSPLVMTGMMSPDKARRVNAAFIGGFKRYHSAFHYGILALNNYGHHSGFIEYGTILSKLQPGLATIIVYVDGTVDMKTWAEKDNETLKTIKHARQNGVPIIDYDPRKRIETIRHLLFNGFDLPDYPGTFSFLSKQNRFDGTKRIPFQGDETGSSSH